MSKEDDSSETNGKEGDEKPIGFFDFTKPEIFDDVIHGLVDFITGEEQGTARRRDIQRQRPFEYIPMNQQEREFDDFLPGFFHEQLRDDLTDFPIVDVAGRDLDPLEIHYGLQSFSMALSGMEQISWVGPDDHERTVYKKPVKGVLAGWGSVHHEWMMPDGSIAKIGPCIYIGDAYDDKATFVDLIPIVPGTRITIGSMNHTITFEFRPRETTSNS